MKLIKIIVLHYLLIVVISCNHRKTNNEALLNSKQRNKTTENSFSKDIEQNRQEKLKLIELILTTSPRYLELTKGLKEKVVKNGGLGFGVSLESSPQETMQQQTSLSMTYDFTIYEMYVERQLNTSRFTFNPVNMQLYEKDIINNCLLPIEFDTTLLLKYDSLNKF